MSTTSVTFGHDLDSVVNSVSPEDQNRRGPRSRRKLGESAAPEKSWRARGLGGDFVTLRITSVCSLAPPELNYAN